MAPALQSLDLPLRGRRKTKNERLQAQFSKIIGAAAELGDGGEDVLIRSPGHLCQR